MKLQDQVCTLEQAKRLKELGVSQESLFSWCGDETKRLMDNGKDGVAVSDWVYIDSTIPANNQEADHRSLVPSARPFAAAYSVAELGVMLGKFWEHELIVAYEFETDNEAIERAHMLIGALETNQVTVEEVNARLCAE